MTLEKTSQPKASASSAQLELLAMSEKWARVERQLDAMLSNIKGISFSEYRMLRSIGEAPSGSASRVELAEALARTPSGVTRALQPLEKLGFVETVRAERDARKALAALTNQGRELVADATGVVNDHAPELLGDLAG